MPAAGQRHGGQADCRPQDEPDQSAVDADILQILAHPQLQLAGDGRGVPRADDAADEIGEFRLRRVAARAEEIAADLLDA